MAKAKKKVETEVEATEEVKTTSSPAKKASGKNKDGFTPNKQVEEKDLFKFLAEQRKK